jgi:raffinose/stachyose/melibiose transport system permease protein
VVTGIIWLWIYNYDWGPLNTLLRVLGLEGLAKPWLGSPRLALYCLIVASTWMWTGFNMVVMLTAMHSLPTEIFEAAEIDGASPFQKTVKIMIPLLRPTLSSLVVLCFVGKMRIFDLVWVTTGGGPLWATETVATYIYKRAFAWNVYDLGYPSALAVIWFVITFVVSLFLGKVIRGKEVGYW